MSSIIRWLGVTALALPLALGGAALATAAPQETASQEAKETGRSAGTAIKDSWLTLKVHSQFVPEDALEGSDIDVDTKAGVVTLTGTVPTQAGRTRAVALAKATDGVKSVNDRLRIAPDTDVASRPDADRPMADRPAGTDTREVGREARDETREAGRETREEAREAGRTTRDAAREATGTTGRAVTDGWIKSKIAAGYVTENALEDSDIDVNVRRGVVTLDGSVPTAGARTRAETIAKSTDGVKSVENKLKVAADAK